MNPQPPRLFERLLHVALPADDAEVIAGDLEESFRTAAGIHGRRTAAWKYRAQVASVIAARIRNSYPADPPRRRANMSAIRQDVACAVRSLRKGPAFTTTAVLLLALGLGANVAIFSLVRAVVLKPLPFADPDQLMLVHMLAPDREAPGVFRRMIWSYPKYLLYRDNQKAFESTAAFTSSAWNLTGAGSGPSERINGELVEATYFGTLHINPVAGRVFSAEETSAPDSEPIVMLGHGMWMRRFGGASVVGQTIGLNGIPHRITGVLPQGFNGLTGQAEVWVPITTLPDDALAEKWNHSYTVVGRRKAEISVEQADAETRTIGAAIDAAMPDPTGWSKWGASAVPLNDERVDPLIRRSMMLMLVAVACVLLLVCINMANLVLVRALSRQREVAIRLALGANRLRIVRQLMTESFLLAAMGAVAAIVVAYALVSIGASMMPDLRMVLPRGYTAGLTRVGLTGVGLDGGVLFFTLALAFVSALLFGLGPAWRASRRDLTEAMKTGSGALSPDTRGSRFRGALVVGEIALALVLLTAGGLMIKSVGRLQTTELGFDPRGLLSARVALPGPQYSAERATRFLTQLVERLAQRPGVTAVAYGNCPPVSGGCNGTNATFPDKPPVKEGTEPVVGVLWTSPQYFQTLGIRLVRGRVFSDHDRIGTPKVVVINEAAARAFWGNEDPVGKRIGVGQGGFGSGAEVIGVVADVRYGAVETSVQPDVYLPLLQSMRASGYVFLRGAVSTEALVATVRSELQTLDPNLPLTDVKLMDQRFGEATWRTRASATLLAAFAALALLLATLGLYSVMSQGVEQRRREIGLRLALGATRGDILRLIVGRVVLIAAAGIATGILFAIPAGRLLSGLLYQVRPGDPVVLAVLSLGLMAIALLAGFIPAQRATRVDPLTSLRTE